MIKTLLAIRFRAMFAGMTAQTAKRKKKQGKGAIILYVVLYLYLIAVVGGVMCLTFGSLAQVYHAMELDWLYFSLAGIMALGLAVIGSVFTTQSQLYDAKDNGILLAMPIPPRTILLSRMVPLLGLNLLFAGIVMIPATVMYAVMVRFHAVTVILPLLIYLGICIFAQAIACLLGWLLHLLLSRVNKSAASMIYMIAFLVVYFVVYGQAGDILQLLTTNAQAIAGALRAWVWPIYAMGIGATGKAWYLLAFLGICAVCFAVVYKILSVTFLSAATGNKSRSKRRKMDLGQGNVSHPVHAVVKKEFAKFIGCPVYLTNMGLGVILTAALPVAGLILRDTLLPVLQLLDPSGSFTPLILCAIFCFMASTICVSTPAISLEGKNIWILKSMPVSPRQILMAKLQNHVILSVPISMVAGLVLAIAYNCSILDILLCTLIPGLLSLFNGLFGLWAGLNWARLDYISEAYPCKQSTSVAVVMFGMMGIPVILGVGYYFLTKWIPFPVSAFLGASALLLAAGCFGFYRLITTWGVQKWESL